MSYCVNCGVELDASAKKCVLCDTPVYNPKQQNEDAPTPYSDRVVLPPKVRRRFSAFLFSVILLLPNIVCLLIDLLVSKENGLYWAHFVNTASLMLWILFVLPFLFQKARTFVLILVDSLAILGYVYFFYHLFATREWFWSMALPLVVVLGVFACVTVEVFERKSPTGPCRRRSSVFRLPFMPPCVRLHCIFISAHHCRLPSPLLSGLAVCLSADSSSMSKTAVVCVRGCPDDSLCEVNYGKNTCSDRKALRCEGHCPRARL